MSSSSMSAREWAMLILLSLIWGSSFVYIAVLVQELAPFSLVFGRTALAALALWAIAFWNKIPFPRDRATWISFFIMGALNNLVPFSLNAWGQQFIDGGLAAIITASSPLFSVAIAHFFTHDEHLTPLRLFGLLFGIGGVAVLLGPKALAQLGLSPTTGGALLLLAELSILAAAACYAVAALYGRRYKLTSPLLSSAGMLTGTAILSLPLMLLFDRPWEQTFSPTGWLLLIGLALVNTSGAYLIYFRLLASAGATNILLVTFLNPVSALLLGALFLGERPGWNALLGMLLISLGLAAVDGRLFHRRTTTSGIYKNP